MGVENTTYYKVSLEYLQYQYTETYFEEIKAQPNAELCKQHLKIKCNHFIILFFWYNFSISYPDRATPIIHFANVLASHFSLVSNPFTTWFAELKPFWPLAAVHLMWGGLYAVLEWLSRRLSHASFFWLVVCLTNCVQKQFCVHSVSLPPWKETPWQDFSVLNWELFWLCSAQQVKSRNIAICSCCQGCNHIKNAK